MHSNSFPPQILTLHFVVLSFDRYSRDDVVGEVMVELEGMDLSGSETCPLSLAREITPRSDKLRSQGRGELLVSLCHQVMSAHFSNLFAQTRLTFCHSHILKRVIFLVRKITAAPSHITNIEINTNEQARMNILYPARG